MFCMWMAAYLLAVGLWGPPLLLLTNMRSCICTKISAFGRRSPLFLYREGGQNLHKKMPLVGRNDVVPLVSSTIHVRRRKAPIYLLSLIHI